MIAPASASPSAPPLPAFVATAPKSKSCCHEPQEQSAVPASQPKMTGRGASSGLILGLKGLAPFDGSQFPRLPWGGKPVSLADIQFIEKWIDDGCPETDAPDVGAEAAGEMAALASGRAEFAAQQGPTNALRNAHGSVKVRKNVKCLTPDELQRFRSAVAQMKSLDMYEQDERSFGYWARIHASQCQHSWEEFLTWHRAYLYFFEQRLQDIDPTVTLPYWDWSADRENVITSINDMGSKAAMDNGYIPEEYGCWIDQQGIDTLKANGVPQGTLDKLASILGKPPYSSGNRLFLAAGIKWGDDPSSDQAIVQVLKTINPLWHYQRWPGGDKALIFEAYPSPDDVTRILQISDFFNFGSGPEDNHFFGALENLHNLIHNFSGGVNPNYGASTEPMNVNNPQNGDMVNAGRTAFDPIFWAHHANVDRLWHEWQKLNPSGGPDDPDDILSPWTMTVADTYSIATLGYEYVKSSHSFPAASDLPIKRFVSQPAGRASRHGAQPSPRRSPPPPRAIHYRRRLLHPRFSQSARRRRLHPHAKQSTLCRYAKHVYRAVHRRPRALCASTNHAPPQVRFTSTFAQDPSELSLRLHRHHRAVAPTGRHRLPGHDSSGKHRRHRSHRGPPHGGRLTRLLRLTSLSFAIGGTHKQ